MSWLVFIAASAGLGVGCAGIYVGGLLGMDLLVHHLGRRDERRRCAPRHGAARCQRVSAQTPPIAEVTR